MKKLSGFSVSLGASALTSMLMLLDRVVLNFIPLFFWGVETTGVWIFIRSWAFVLMSFEGGVGGRLSNIISKLYKSSCSRKDIIKRFKLAQHEQFIWGGAVLLINYLGIRIGLLTDINIFGFQAKDIFVDIVLFGGYALLYYQTQLIVYAMRGIGNVAFGQMIANAAKLTEITLLIVIPYIGGNITNCIIALIIVRIITIIIGNKLCQRQIFYKISNNTTNKTSLSITKSKSDIKVMLGYFLYPLYPAIYNFLPIALVSAILSPMLVVQFSVSRLLGRIITQISQILSRVLWPELLKKKSQKEFLNFSKEVLKSYFLITSCTLIIVISLAYFLDGVHYKGIDFNFRLTVILSCVAFLASFNDIILAILISQEKHFYPLVVRSLGFISITLVLFYMGSIDVNYIAYSLLIFEVIIFFIMLAFGFKQRKNNDYYTHA